MGITLLLRCLLSDDTLDIAPAKAQRGTPPESVMKMGISRANVMNHVGNAKAGDSLTLGQLHRLLCERTGIENARITDLSVAQLEGQDASLYDFAICQGVLERRPEPSAGGRHVHSPPLVSCDAGQICDIYDDDFEQAIFFLPKLNVFLCDRQIRKDGDLLVP